MPSHLSILYHHVCIVEEEKILLIVPPPITVSFSTYWTGVHLCWSMTNEPVWCMMKAQSPSSGLAGKQTWLRTSDPDAHKGRRHRYGATILELSN